ncbi:hypothetical protein J5N97_028118 [Dioscorea zingiberensis]|uniref:WRKY domain-containing protein n=1 Tax=Dioscorea zingiberensis TaxID=325984 RepID=A0A9D5BYL2_9LILI|nr:hypothetical protein J5N97_028118 [Dioscorea zingiberensis]
MEPSRDSLDHKRLIEVLTMAQVQTMQLKANLSEHQPSFELCKSLAQNIHFALNEAISISMAKLKEQENHLPPVCFNSPSPDSPVTGSPPSESSERKEMSKKRKTLPKWSNQVRVSPGAMMDTPLDDGYSWRKYGQKDILGAKYPRGYYRCTHRNAQGCLATKQVQRSDSDPSIFDVTYRGEHTCIHKLKPKASASQENQQDYLSLSNNLKVKIEGQDHEQASTFSFPSSQLTYLSTLDNHFMDNNYFSVSPCVNNQQTTESDFNEIISTMTSTTNSPVVDMDFMDINLFDPNNFLP